MVAVLLVLSSDAAAQGPVSTAFRDRTREIGEKIVLSAEVLPSEMYSFKPTPTQSTFAELITRLVARTDYLCGRIGGARPPAPGADMLIAQKDSLVSRLRTSFSRCDEALASLGDSQLADSIVVDMREAFPFAPRQRTRAATMLLATEYWAEIYGQLSQYVRLNGRVPPAPCGRDSDDTTSCDSGVAVCRPTPPGGRPALATFTDRGHSVRSDGRGDYVNGVDAAGVFAAQVLVVYWPIPVRNAQNPRTILVDLTQPVAGGKGVPLGVIAERSAEVSAQWYTEADQTQHSMLAIPVGTTVEGRQLSVVFSINGIRHALQMGPQVLGHCFSDGSVMFGDGTTRPTIQRPSEGRWIVDLPSGSVGRLFDIHLGEPNAIDKGLYYVSLHLEFRTQ